MRALRLAKGASIYREVRSLLRSPQPSDIWFDGARDTWLLTFEGSADPEHVFVFAVATQPGREPHRLATVHEVTRSEAGWRSSRVFLASAPD